MRRAGILLHPTSLPGPGPCGDLGPGALAFLDWLEQAGCSLWQVLPLCPPGGGFSPYDSPGALALGTHLLSVDDLVRDGLLPRKVLAERPNFAPARVDLDGLSTWRAPLVAQAASALAHDDPAALIAFATGQAWVADWALYLALIEEQGKTRGWWDLPPSLRDRQTDALDGARERLKNRVDQHIASQLLVHRQWQRLRDAATARGILLVGDLPIFVAGAGVDTWTHRELFRWRQTPRAARSGCPVADPVAGVPPDYFSPKGQRWGNPLYDWPAHQADGFAWWRARARAALTTCHAVRIDHFRAFCAAWAVPADAPDATTGQWSPGPGRALFDAIREDLRADPPPGLDPNAALPIIAEDLGIITPDVGALRDELGLPGMKVLQFAFGEGNDHPFLPHTWTHDRWVAYTGTHDNDTVRGWYATTNDRVRDHFRRYVGRDGSQPHWQLLRPLLASVARWAIAPLQDVMGLDASGRMNVPGTASGNWLWRARVLPWDAAPRLRDLNSVYGRLPARP